MTDTGWISDIVKEVYLSAEQKGFGKYEKPLGREDWPDHLQRPEVPGDSAYPFTLDVTAYRILGADPGFHSHKAHDVTQQAIRANLQSFIDGLNLFFPDKAIKNYMLTKLAKPAFNNLLGSGHDATYMERILGSLPRAHEMAKLSLWEGSNRSFRRSLEHDFVSAGHLFSVPIDAPERRRDDRKVLSNDELHFSYLYSRHLPELWVGLMVWQNIICQYTNEMTSLYYGEQFSTERIDSPQARFLRFVEGAVESNISFQSFIIPHIIGRAIQKERLFDKSLAPIDIVDGILQARENGIFRREFESYPFGSRRTICPFGASGTRWLVQNLYGTDDPADTSLVFCYKKVIAEKDSNPKVKAFCSAVSEVLTKVMAEYGGVPETVEAATLSPHAPMSSVTSEENGSIKCPYHQSLG